jgi:hypothetical protein
MSSNSDKRFGLTERTGLERNIWVGRQCEALGAAIRIKYGTPFLHQSIARSTFFLRTVTTWAIVQLLAPLFCDVSSLYWEIDLAKGAGGKEGWWSQKFTPKERSWHEKQVIQHSENVYNISKWVGRPIGVGADVRFTRNPRPLARYMVYCSLNTLEEGRWLVLATAELYPERKLFFFWPYGFLFRAEVKNEFRCTSALPQAFTACSRTALWDIRPFRPIATSPWMSFFIPFTRVNVFLYNHQFHFSNTYVSHFLYFRSKSRLIW